MPGARSKPISLALIASVIVIGVTAIAQAPPTGLGLDGAGVRVGVWDSAHARDTHVELRGRVRRRDLGGFSQHATHTTSALAGDGTGDPDARGMAAAAEVWSYDWLLDLVELEEAAPALAISSHAYGPTSGFSSSGDGDCPGHPSWHGAPGAREDAAFGRYGAEQAALDAIALRTDLLTIWPAGNERVDSGPEPDEPHYHAGSCDALWSDIHVSEHTLQRDTIGGLGLAKNALMVGAVRVAPDAGTDALDVVLLDESGFGPTDDGRIKPQLVAPGYAVRTASVHEDDAYAAGSGTSSATAAVAGAGALLVELYRRLHAGADPRAAELLALLVHSARDLDAPGPDVESGYGLLDAQAAAALLVADAEQPSAGRQLVLATIDAGQTLTLRSTSDAPRDRAVRVTLAWTDPPAEPARGDVDEPRAVLVDDLDLSLRTADGRTHLPWSLDAGGARVARGAPNTRDNLELVDVEALDEAGSIEVQVRAPASLRRGGPRAFALVSSVPLIAPAQPILALPRYVDATRPASGSRLSVRAPLASVHGTPLAFRTRALEPFLAVTPDSGEAPAELSIELDLDALGGASEAIGHVVIESDDASGPRILAVVLQDPPCEPDCDGLACGADPRCGVACGACPPTQACEAGSCVPAAASCPNADLGDALGVAFVEAWPRAPGDEEGSCMGPSAGESSFRWQAREAGRYAITVRDPARATVLYARRGACRGEELACDDDASGIGSGIGLALDAGESVVLFADTYEDDLGQPIALSIERAACPGTSLGSRLGQGVARGVTSGGLDLLAGGCGGGDAEEARFAWSAPYAGSFRFALFDPVYQAVLHVRDDDCDGEELSCTVAADVGPVELALAAGQQVAVIVDGAEGRSGPFTLDIVDAEASCEGACGAASDDGRCACDADCVAAGDCCADACELCGACRCERACQGKRCGPDGCGGQCGACAQGLACQDGACVIDACDGVRCDACETCEAGRCVALAEGAACEDGDACTRLDACTRGRCEGVARDCDDGLACTLDRCDPDNGHCSSRASADCCDGGTGCESMSLGDGGAEASPRRPLAGCGCDLAGDPDPPDPLPGAALLLTVGWWTRSRRRRHAKGWHLPQTA